MNEVEILKKGIEYRDKRIEELEKELYEAENPPQPPLTSVNQVVTFLAEVSNGQIEHEMTKYLYDLLVQRGYLGNIRSAFNPEMNREVLEEEALKWNPMAVFLLGARFGLILYFHQKEINSRVWSEVLRRRPDVF